MKSKTKDSNVRLRSEIKKKLEVIFYSIPYNKNYTDWYSRFMSKARATGAAPEEIQEFLSDASLNYDSKTIMKDAASVALKKLGQVKKQIKDRKTKDEDQDSLKEKLIAFFKANPNPDDDKVHAFAEQNNIDPHELEEEIYKLVTEHVGMVKDSKSTAKDKMLKGLDSLRRKVKDAFGMNIEEKQKQFDVRNIEKETVENNAFRKVIFTGNTLQLVLMSLLPNEDIGMEVHQNVDQFFRVEEGEGLLEIKDQGTYPLKAGSSMLVTAGTQHNVINNGSEPLKLYTLYGPPNHPADRLQNTKAEAVEAEKVTKDDDNIEILRAKALKKALDDFYKGVAEIDSPSTIAGAQALTKSINSETDINKLRRMVGDAKIEYNNALNCINYKSKKNR